MTLRLALAAAMLLVVVPSVAWTLPAGSQWRIGEPIVWYWAGPGSHNDVNDTTVAQLAAGGWNLGWDMGWPRTDEPKYLDVYHRHGMRVLFNLGRYVSEWEGNPDFDFNDARQTRELDELIARVRNHPAVYAYYLWDEPNASRFPFFGRFVAHLRKLDPTRPTFVNLYPLVADPAGQLGTATYEEHVRQFVDIVKPDVLCYDYYPFMARGDALSYFLNLMIIREAALAAGVPFINVTQAIAHEDMGYRWPTEHEMRWLAYTTLAYGGQGICWYIYNCRNCGLSGFFEDCPESVIPKPNYWAASRTNRDFVAIGTELQPLRSLAAYHLGPHEKAGGSTAERWNAARGYVYGPLPWGGMELPATSRFRVDSVDRERDFLLGCFGPPGSSRSSHILVVNLDYKNSAAAVLKGPGPMDVFHAPTRTWTPGPIGAEVALDLPPGGGLLVRLR